MTSAGQSLRQLALAGSLHWCERLRNGQVVDIRSLSGDDCKKESAFLSRLTEESRGYRFLGVVRDRHEDIAPLLVNLDREHEIALGAFATTETGEIEIGAAWYRTYKDGCRCDCTVTVDPQWQQLGVGSVLMGHLIEVAHACGVRHMHAAEADGCAGMHTLAERMGFHSRPDSEDPAVTIFERTLA